MKIHSHRMLYDEPPEHSTRQYKWHHGIRRIRDHSQPYNIHHFPTTHAHQKESKQNNKQGTNAISKIKINNTADTPQQHLLVIEVRQLSVVLGDLLQKHTSNCGEVSAETRRSVLSEDVVRSTRNKGVDDGHVSCSFAKALLKKERDKERKKSGGKKSFKIWGGRKNKVDTTSKTEKAYAAEGL